MDQLFILLFFIFYFRCYSADDSSLHFELMSCKYTQNGTEVAGGFSNKFWKSSTFLSREIKKSTFRIDVQLHSHLEFFHLSESLLYEIL